VGARKWLSKKQQYSQKQWIVGDQKAAVPNAYMKTEKAETGQTVDEMTRGKSLAFRGELKIQDKGTCLANCGKINDLHASESGGPGCPETEDKTFQGGNSYGSKRTRGSEPKMGERYQQQLGGKYCRGAGGKNALIGSWPFLKRRGPDTIQSGGNQGPRLAGWSFSMMEQ